MYSKADFAVFVVRLTRTVFVVHDDLCKIVSLNIYMSSSITYVFTKTFFLSCLPLSSPLPAER